MVLALILLIFFSWGSEKKKYKHHFVCPFSIWNQYLLFSEELQRFALAWCSQCIFPKAILMCLQAAPSFNASPPVPHVQLEKTALTQKRYKTWCRGLNRIPENEKHVWKSDISVPGAERVCRTCITGENRTPKKFYLRNLFSKKRNSAECCELLVCFPILRASEYIQKKNAFPIQLFGLKLQT